MTVCFFGHRDTPESVRTELKREIERLIGEGANHFYVGSQGRFDAMALGCVRELAAGNPGVSYQVVLAYLPKPGEQGNQPEETLKIRACASEQVDGGRIRCRDCICGP